MKVNFLIDTINTLADVRDALQNIKQAVEGATLLKGEYKFVQITVKSAANNLKYSHNLSFTPIDVILLSVSNSAAVTWNYDSFDSSFIVLSTTGPCTVRAYIGRHKEG